MYNPIPPPRPSLQLLSSIPPAPRRPAPSAVSHCNSATYTNAPASSNSQPVLVTHLAKNTLKMRHKIPAHHRNPLKQRSLKPHV
jgi:hypothetical protein